MGMKLMILSKEMILHLVFFNLLLYWTQKTIWKVDHSSAERSNKKISQQNWTIHTKKNCYKNVSCKKLTFYFVLSFLRMFLWKLIFSKQILLPFIPLRCHCKVLHSGKFKLNFCMSNNRIQKSKSKTGYWLFQMFFFLSKVLNYKKNSLWLMVK